jgi:hypothetical protein
MARRSNRGLIAGVTYDKFLGEAGNKRTREVRKRYTNSLIAFIDLLGIKEFIEQHRDGDEHEAIDTIDKISKIVNDSCTYFRKQSHKIDYLQISDSFVFLCEPKAIVALINLVSNIQTRIVMECYFLLRGAITIGDAIIRDEGRFIVGPAYIQAYLLQEKDAIYPRIIVDNSVIKQLTKIKEPLDDYLKQDSDKEQFVDYLKVYMRFLPESKQSMKSSLRKESVCSCIFDEYKKYSKADEHNISQKYGWTIQYYKNSGVWDL